MEVNFNDARCATDGGRVCPTDSLLFTCIANEIITLRVTLPSGGMLVVFSDGWNTGSLPDGFSVESSSVAVNYGGISSNYTLSLSIDNASLLAGGVIVCDDGTPGNQDMAGCPSVGKFYNHLFIITIIVYIRFHVYSLKEHHNKIFLNTCSLLFV